MVSEIPSERWDSTSRSIPIYRGDDIGFTSPGAVLEGYLIPLYNSKIYVENTLPIPSRHDITINKPSLLKEMPGEIRGESESEKKNIIIDYFRMPNVRKQILKKKQNCLRWVRAKRFDWQHKNSTNYLYRISVVRYPTHESIRRSRECA
jgi:hypothetical protein